MKKIFLNLCIVLLTCFLAGCGQTDRIEGNTGESMEQEPIVITYGYIDADPVVELDNEIKKQIAHFNRSQSEYVIEIKQYGNDNYADGLAALNAELAAGKGPDLIQIDRETQYRDYTAKGMLTDLYLFLDADESLQREAFFAPVLKQLEYQNQLCALSPFFALNSIIGNPNYIAKEGITFEEFYGMWEKEEEVEIFRPMSRERVLSFGCEFEMGSFVDLAQGSCQFTGKEFVDLLTFSACFPSQNMQPQSTCELYRAWQENRVCMMYDGPIGSFDEYTKYKSLLGQDALLIGWPAVEGCGPVVSFNFPYLAINGNSARQDAAWEFLRSLLQPEFLLAEGNERKGFPVLKGAFEQQAKEAMEINWGTDAEGNPVEIPGQNICHDRDGTEISWPVYAATEEEVEYLRTTIENLEILPDYGEIPTIIYEEAADYWNGNRSAEEAAEIIQNRVQLYLDEGQ